MLNMDPGVCVLILYNQSKRNPFGFYCWGKKYIYIYISPENESADNYIKKRRWRTGILDCVYLY